MFGIFSVNCVPPATLGVEVVLLVLELNSENIHFSFEFHGKGLHKDKLTNYLKGKV